MSRGWPKKVLLQESCSIRSFNFTSTEIGFVGGHRGREIVRRNELVTTVTVKIVKTLGTLLESEGGTVVEVNEHSTVGVSVQSDTKTVSHIRKRENVRDPVRIVVNLERDEVQIPHL